MREWERGEKTGFQEVVRFFTFLRAGDQKIVRMNFQYVWKKREKNEWTRKNVNQIYKSV